MALLGLLLAGGAWVGPARGQDAPVKLEISKVLHPIRQRLLTVAPADVPCNLEYITLPMRLVDPDLRHLSFGGRVAELAGCDIRFTDLDGHPLQHEIEAYDPVTGALTAHVHLPLVTDLGGANFLMEYGQAGTVCGPNPNAFAWDPQFVMVQHMTAAVEDSSVFGNDGTAVGVVEVPGLVGSALAFDGVGDFVRILSDTSLEFAGDYTLEMLVRPDNASSTEMLLAKDYWMRLSGGVPGLNIIGVGSEDAVAALPADQWSHLAFRFVHGPNTWGPHTLELYVNGSLAVSAQRTGTPQISDLALILGAHQETSAFFAGRLDEVRFSSEARRPCWIQFAADAALGNLVDAGPPGDWLPTELREGEAVTFCIEVSNPGTTDCPAVVASDPLPAGFAFLAASAPGYDPGSGDWNLGTLTAGTTATLCLDLRVTAANGCLTNVATGNGAFADASICVIPAPYILTCPPGPLCISEGTPFPDIAYDLQLLTTDDCRILWTQQLPPAGTVLGIGTQEVLILAYDSFGNSYTCTTLVEVKVDPGPCIPVCPPDIHLTCGLDSLAVVPEITAAMLGNACPVTILDQVPAAGTALAEGAYDILVSMVDIDGNLGECTTRFFVECPSCTLVCTNQIDADGGFDCEAVVPTIVPDVLSDTPGYICGITVLSQDPAPGTVLGAGAYDILVTAMDLRSNMLSCVTRYVVTCPPPPTCTLVCTNQIDADGGFDCEAVVPTIVPEVLSDTPGYTCEVTVVSQDPAPGTVLGAGIYDISVTAIDGRSNILTCVTRYLVTCPTCTLVCTNRIDADGGFDCEAVVPAIVPDVLSDTPGYTCEVTVVSQDPAPGTVLGAGAYDIWVTAIDPGSNILSCVTRYIVTCPPPPICTLVCTNQIDADGGFDCEAVVPEIFPDVLSDTPGYTCEVTVVSQDPAPGTILGAGAYDIWVTAIDARSNTILCATRYVVTCPLPPICTLVCTNQIDADGGFDCEAVVPEIFPDVLSDTPGYTCEVTVVSQDPAPGTVLGAGANDIWVTAIDARSNILTCVTRYVVTCPPPPICTLVCTNWIDADGGFACEAVVPEIVPDVLSDTPGYTCAVTVVSQVPAPGTVLGAGAYDIWVTAIDARGNTLLCATRYVVTCPSCTLQCPVWIDADGGFDCEAVVPEIVPDVLSDTPGYTCEVTVVSQVPAPGTVLGAGAYDIWITAIDAASNTLLCATRYVVTCPAPPTCTLVCPHWIDADGGFDCEAVVPEITPTVVSDTPGFTCEVTVVSQDPAPGTVLGAGAYDIWVTATDAASNILRCATRYVVTCPPAPTCTLQCPPWIDADGGIDCEAVVPAIVPEVLSDTPGYTCEVTVVSQDPAPGTVLGAGAYDIWVTTIDDASNVLQCATRYVVTCPPPPTCFWACVEAEVSLPAAWPECRTEVPVLAGVMTAENPAFPCATVNEWQVPAAGTEIGPGLTEVTLYAEDSYGTVHQCITRLLVDCHVMEVADLELSKSTRGAGMRMIWIGPEQVDCTLSNFPVQVRLQKPELRHTTFGGSVLNLSGCDILFRDRDGNQLPHELADYDPFHGSVEAWVLAPAISDDTGFGMQLEYGLAVACPSEDPQAVWADAYEFVAHFDDLFAYVGGATNTALNSGATPVEGGFQFDGVDDTLTFPAGQLIPPGSDFTVEVAFTPTCDDSMVLASKGIPGSHPDWHIRIEDGHPMFILHGLGCYHPGVAAELGACNVFAVTFRHGPNPWGPHLLELYLNGELVMTEEVTGTYIESAGDVFVGSYLGESGFYCGTVDDLRVSSVARDACTLRAAADTLCDPYFVRVEFQRPFAGVDVGDPVHFCITVCNRGPAATGPFTVRDQLPEGLDFIAASSGSYDPITGEWDLPGLGVGTCASLEITALFLGTQAKVFNQAEIIAPVETYDPDSTPGNGELYEDDHDMVLICLPDSDNDGMADLHEIIAGTDPNDPDSSLELVATPVIGSDATLVQWTSEPGRTYTLYCLSDLSAPPVVVATGLVATPDTNQYLDTHPPADGLCIYYVVVE